jgi:hypothetical protein
LTIARQSKRSAALVRTTPSSLVTEMNETSMTITVGAKGRSDGCRARALTRSITVTRGSVRSFQSSWP